MEAEKKRRQTQKQSRIVITSVWSLEAWGDAGQRTKAFSCKTKSTDVLTHDMQMKAYN